MSMNEYEEQARDFLIATKATIKTEYLEYGPHFKSESECRDIYRVTLKTPKGQYSFSFGDSIYNSNSGREKVLDPYSILACLDGGELLSFGEFIGKFGYDIEDREDKAYAVSVWEAVSKEIRNLRGIFSEDELELLAEIQ